MNRGASVSGLEATIRDIIHLAQAEGTDEDPRPTVEALVEAVVIVTQGPWPQSRLAGVESLTYSEDGTPFLVGRGAAGPRVGVRVWFDSMRTSIDVRPDGTVDEESDLRPDPGKDADTDPQGG